MYLSLETTAVLRFLRAYIATHGHAPSYREKAGVEQGYTQIATSTSGRSRTLNNAQQYKMQPVFMRLLHCF